MTVLVLLLPAQRKASAVLQDETDMATEEALDEDEESCYRSARNGRSRAADSRLGRIVPVRTCRSSEVAAANAVNT